MNRKIFRLLLACCFMLLCIPFANAQKNERKNYQLLWRIEGPKLKKPSYLFGTMHLKDERVFDFSDSVLVALDKADAFAMEVDMDTAMNYMINPNSPIWADTTNYLKRKLSTEEYQFVNKRVEDKLGYSIDRLQNKTFWFVEFLLQDSEDVLDAYKSEKDSAINKESIFLDGYFHQKARMLKKQMFGLERIENQFMERNSENLPYRKESFLEAVGYYDEDLSESERKTGEMMNAFVDIYYEGNLDFLAKYELNDHVLVYRNKEMANSIDKIIRTKSLFAAVGAAHLPGQNGLINLLKKKGYKVTQVKATFTGLAKVYKDRYAKLKGYKLDKIAEGYSVVMPSIPLAYSLPNTNRQMYVSLYEGTEDGAFAISTKTTSAEGDNEDILNNMMANFATKMSALKGEVKNITYGDFVGKEAVLTSQMTDFKARAYVRNGNVYFFMHTLKKGNEAVVDSFFNSIKLFEVAPRVAAYKKVSITEKAFEVLLPDDYTFASNEAFNAFDTANERPKSLYSIYTASDHVKKVSYYIRIDEMGEGYYSKNDSIFISGIKDLFKSDTAIITIDSSVCNLNGFKGLKTRLLNKNKYIAELRQFPRGNRLYSVMIQYNPTKSDTNMVSRFFNSFKLLPLNSEPLTTNFTPEDSLFTVKINREMIADQKQLQRGVSTTYVSSDKLSRSTYLLQQLEFEPYYWTSTDSLFATLKQSVTSDSVIVLNEKKYVQERVHFYDLVCKHLNSSLQSSRRFILSGRKLFEITAIEPNEVANKGLAQQYLNSFKLNPLKVDTTDLSRNKLAEIFRDVTSTDSVTAKNAKDAFGYIVLDNNDKKQIHEVLLNNSIKEDRVKISMLNCLAGEPDSLSLPLVKVLYNSPETTNLVKRNLLEFLTESGSENAIALFEKLVINYKNDNGYAFNVFSYKLKRNKNYEAKYLPEFIELAKKSPEFLKLFVEYTNYDSIWIEPKFTNYQLKSLVRPMQKSFDTFYLKFKKVLSTDSTYWFQHSQISDFLNVFNNPALASENVKRFKQFITDSSSTLRSHAIIGLFNAKQKVKDDDVLKLLNDKENGYLFVQEAQENGTINLINHLLDQEKVTSLYLTYYLQEDYTVDTLEMIRSVEIEAGGEKKRLFLFKCKLDGEEKDYYVIVGPQPFEKNKFNFEPGIVSWLEDSTAPTVEQTAEFARHYYDEYLKSAER